MERTAFFMYLFFLTLIGMRGDTFISLSFLDQICQLNFYQKFQNCFGGENRVNLQPDEIIKSYKKCPKVAPKMNIFLLSQLVPMRVKERSKSLHTSYTYITFASISNLMKPKDYYFKLNRYLRFYKVVSLLKIRSSMPILRKISIKHLPMCKSILVHLAWFIQSLSHLLRVAKYTHWVPFLYVQCTLYIYLSTYSDAQYEFIRNDLKCSPESRFLYCPFFSLVRFPSLFSRFSPWCLRFSLNKYFQNSFSAIFYQPILIF